MNTNKITLLSGLLLLVITGLLTLLPTYVVSVMILSIALFYAAFYFNQNYDIDYKYWFSFCSQLGGLLLIVASFVMMMVIISNILSQN